MVMDTLILLFLISKVAEPVEAFQTDMDATRNGSSGIITSPGYPGNYPNNVKYTWTLNTGNLKSAVFFNFHYFNITKYHYTPYCEDFLLIKETYPCCWEAIKRCGYFKPFGLTVKGSIISISFVPDHLHNAKGFNLSWKVYKPETSTSKTTLTTRRSKINMKVSTTYFSMTRTRRQGSTYKEMSSASTDISTIDLFKEFKEHVYRHTFENNIRKTIREQLKQNEIKAITESNNRKTSLIKTVATGRIPVTFLLTHLLDLLIQQNTSISTAITDPNKREPSLIKTDTTRKLLVTLLSTQSLIQQNTTISTVYLVTFIGVLEVILTAVGICLKKQRQVNNFGNLKHLKTNENMSHACSTSSKTDFNKHYERIQQAHVSNDHTIQEWNDGKYTDIIQEGNDSTYTDIIQERNDSTYIDIIDYEYDTAHGHKLPVTDTVALNQIVS